MGLFGNISNISNTLTKALIEDNKKVIHEVAVLATMSSGKSTLINSLLGEDLLPNENQACTAKIFKVVDNDEIKKNKITAIFKDDSCKEISKQELIELNCDSNIKDIIIEGDFKGIENKVSGDKLHQISLIDTPGPNNSLDKSHAKIAQSLISNENTNDLIYVLNATQIGVNDDKKLLVDILDNQKTLNREFKIIFVLNKVDQIDFEKENLKEIINNVKNYLGSIGIDNPKIIPLSAYAAKIFKMGLSNKLNTRKERKDFELYYNLFESFKISKLEPNEFDDDEEIVIGNNIYSRNKVLKSLYSTGLIDLEMELQEFLTDQISLVNHKRKNSVVENMLIKFSNRSNFLKGANMENSIEGMKKTACEEMEDLLLGIEFEDEHYKEKVRNMVSLLKQMKSKPYDIVEDLDLDIQFENEFFEDKSKIKNGLKKGTGILIELRKFYGLFFSTEEVQLFLILELYN